MWKNNKEHDLYPFALQFYQHLPQETRQKLRRSFNRTYFASLLCGGIVIAVLTTWSFHILFEYVLKGISEIPITENETAPALIIFVLVFSLDLIFFGTLGYGARRMGVWQDSMDYFEKVFFPHIKAKKLHQDYFIPGYPESKNHDENTDNPDKIYWRDVRSTEVVIRKKRLSDDMSMKFVCLDFRLKHTSYSEESPYITLAKKIISNEPNKLGKVVKEFCEELISRTKGN